MFRHAICHTRERRLTGSFRIVSLLLIDSVSPFILLLVYRLLTLYLNIFNLRVMYLATVVFFI